MAFSLPPLPYATDALEPHIDKMTMEIHHGKHHNAYVTNLNKALESAPDLAGKIWKNCSRITAATVPENIRTAVRNNGGGHSNHSMFWQIMAPTAAARPRETWRTRSSSTFGSFDAFKEKFNAAAATRFGSGWAWLVKSRKQSRGDLDRQPGQPGDGRQVPGDGPRRLGACLLPEVPESPPGLHLRPGGTW